MKVAIAAATAAMLALSGPAMADESGPLVLKEGSFVCVSPEAYAEAQERLKTAKSRFKLSEQLMEERLCIMVDDEDLEDMMAPFVKVTERSADLIKVQYEVEYYKRIEFLHRAFARVIFSGWTHGDQLMPRADIGKK